MQLPITKNPKKTCARKRRFADEFAARAGAMNSLVGKNNPSELNVYQCSICRGWHLTRFPESVPVKIDDPYYEPTLADQMLELMKEGRITSYFGESGSTSEMQIIHETCLELERDGKIFREREVKNGIVWNLTKNVKVA